MIGKPARKARRAAKKSAALARKAAAVHKKAAKWGVKAHKKVGKFGVKIAKKIIKKPGKAALAGATMGMSLGGTAGKVARGIATGGLSTLAAKGTTGRVSRGIASGGMSEGFRMVKKLFKKKDTNVRVSGKQKRREKLDARKGAPSAKVVARRARKDAKDVERFADKDKARTRVNKQITKRNVNQERSDTLYKSRAEINRDKLRRQGAPGGRRGQGRGARAPQSRAAQEVLRARVAARRARQANR